MRANAESFKSWLLADRGQLEMPGLYQKKSRASDEQSWYKVMCLSDGRPEADQGVSSQAGWFPVQFAVQAEHASENQRRAKAVAVSSFPLSTVQCIDHGLPTERKLLVISIRFASFSNRGSRFAMALPSKAATVAMVLCGFTFGR